MKKLLILIGLALASVIHAAELETAPGFSRLYFATFATATTTKFANDSYGYGLGVGYQLTSVWSAEAQIEHEGFDFSGRAVQDIGLRFVVGSPLKAIPAVRPYAYVGAGYRLESDAWHVDPGLGFEFSLGKTVALFAETGLRADLNNTFDWRGAAGVRLRF